MQKKEDTVKFQLSKWQKKFVLDGFDNPLRIACTGISAGKSRALALWNVMQMVKKPGCRCIGIAQTHKALKRVLIREMQIVCNLLGLHYDYNKSEQEFSLDNGSILFGYSGENAEAMLGLSEIDILSIDESAYLAEEAYQYASDRMRGGKYEPMVRLISSPQSMAAENWFSEVCKRHPEDVIRATALDNPFTSDTFKQNLKDRYIEGSNIYRQQVLGEIFDFDIASQIVMRKDFIAAKLICTDKRYWLGADFAGLGTDSNIVAVIDDTGVVDWFGAPDLNTQQKTEQVSNAWDHWRPVSACGDQTGGYGQGCIDLLEAKQMHMVGVNFSQKPFNEKLYPNARTEMFIELAQAIKQGFWVPEEAKIELLAIQYCIDNRGRQSLLPKDLVKKQLGGRSPDLADAIALALYAKNHGEASTVSGYSAKQASDVANRLMSFMR